MSEKINDAKINNVKTYFFENDTYREIETKAEIKAIQLSMVINGLKGCLFRTDKPDHFYLSGENVVEKDIYQKLNEGLITQKEVDEHEKMVADIEFEAKIQAKIQEQQRQQAIEAIEAEKVAEKQ